jgi:hypothetical protein
MIRMMSWNGCEKQRPWTALRYSRAFA